MSFQKKISKTLEVSSNLKLHFFNDNSFEIFFRGSPGGYYFVFSSRQELLYRVHKSAYGIGKPSMNLKNNWATLKECLNKENQKNELPSQLKKFLLWRYEQNNKIIFREEKIGPVSYFTTRH
jgi:hypothetical protein